MSESKEKTVPQLAPTSMLGFDFVSTRYDALVGHGVKPEDLLNPAYWAHHAVKLKPMDEIRARAEDGTWVSYLVVLDSSRTWAKVKELHRFALGTADVALTQASQEEFKVFVASHKVVHRAAHKWSVVRDADKAVLAEGMAEKDAAVKWLDDYARKQLGMPQAAPAKQPEPAPA